MADVLCSYGMHQACWLSGKAAVITNSALES